MGLSFTASIRGGSLEEPAIGSGEIGAPDGMPAILEGMATPGWTALLGDGGRFLGVRNGDESTDKKLGFFCLWSDMLWSGCNQQTDQPHTSMVCQQLLKSTISALNHQFVARIVAGEEKECCELHAIVRKFIPQLKFV